MRGWRDTEGEDLVDVEVPDSGLRVIGGESKVFHVIGVDLDVVVRRTEVFDALPIERKEDVLGFGKGAEVELLLGHEGIDVSGEVKTQPLLLLAFGGSPGSYGEGRATMGLSWNFCDASRGFPGLDGLPDEIGVRSCAGVIPLVVRLGQGVER